MPLIKQVIFEHEAVAVIVAILLVTLIIVAMLRYGGTAKFSFVWRKMRVVFEGRAKDQIASTPSHVQATPATISDAATPYISAQSKPHAYICRTYGNIWQTLKQDIEEAGFEVSYIDDNNDLQKATVDLGVMIITGSGHTGERRIYEQDVKAMTDFVAGGGGLLCAAQAWSWVYPQYGNKPIDDFPLNRLGKALGFHITGSHVDDPSDLEGPLKDQGYKMHRGQWAASEIQTTSPSKRPLVRDPLGRIMALMLTHKLGRVVVVGHEGMLSENKWFLHECLRMLRPQRARHDSA